MLLSAQSHFQYTFFRPAHNKDCTPECAGTNWKDKDTHTRLLILFSSTTTGLNNGTWRPCEPFDLPGTPLWLLGYRHGELGPGSPCLDQNGQTAICHAPAGILATNPPYGNGTHTAAFNYSDNVPHAHDRKGTYWLKDVNAGGVP